MAKKKIEREHHKDSPTVDLKRLKFRAQIKKQVADWERKQRTLST